MTISFDPASPWLILAPHLQYPLVNGADISIENIGKYVSYHVGHVVIIGESTVRRYKMGTIIEETSFINNKSIKHIAAFKTLVYDSHYLLEKFNTNSFVELSTSFLQNELYKTVLYSFISTTSITRHTKLRNGHYNIVWTHNDELKWFKDLYETSANPLTRLVANRSLRWLKKWFHKNSNDFLLLHVTEEDTKGYQLLFPNHRYLQVSIGVEEEDTNDMIYISGNSNNIKLLFLGSLSTQMNLDALIHFKNDFYPILKAQFADRLVVQIVGSNPLPGVKKLCQEFSWQLNANVDDNTLTSLLHGADFSILPFNYATGAKLKLLKSLANGLPYLGTTQVNLQLDEIPPLCLVSDDPRVWLNHITNVINIGGITINERKNLQAFARKFSWRHVADHLYNELVRINKQGT